MPLCKGPESDQELFLKSQDILYFRWHRIAPVTQDRHRSLTEACRKLHSAWFPATTCTIESVASRGLVAGLLYFIWDLLCSPSCSASINAGSLPCQWVYGLEKYSSKTQSVLLGHSHLSPQIVPWRGCFGMPIPTGPVKTC